MTKYVCGPENHQIEFDIELPKQKELLGVLISGGIDSAILYYLILLENIKMGNIHEIVPCIVPRSQLSNRLAVAVVKQVQRSLNLPYVKPVKVGDGSLPDHRQVSSGMAEAASAGFKKLYLGVIVRLPEHSIGWVVVKIVDTSLQKVPMINLDKSHIIDLVIKMKQECLFHITSSCDLTTGRCGQCNGCVEREWGFKQVGAVDPGKL